MAMACLACASFSFRSDLEEGFVAVVPSVFLSQFLLTLPTRFYDLWFSYSDTLNVIQLSDQMASERAYSYAMFASKSPKQIAGLLPDLTSFFRLEFASLMTFFVLVTLLISRFLPKQEQWLFSQKQHSAMKRIMTRMLPPRHAKKISQSNPSSSFSRFQMTVLLKQYWIRLLPVFLMSWSTLPSS